MKIFTKAFATALLVFSVSQAQAKRWILKNPKVSLPTADVVQNIQLGNSHYVVIEAESSLDPVSTAAFSLNLMNMTKAEFAIPDLKIQIDEPPAIQASEGWHLDRLKYKDIPKDVNGNGVVVAVIDSGVDYKHSALVNHMWINKNEIPNNQIDDDKNGYVDDVYGYNFDAQMADPMDEMGHGTHCSGIIAADENTDHTARGVAPGVKIMALKVIGNASQGFISNAVLAIKYAVDNGARVMSNSWRIYGSWSQYYTPESLSLLGDALNYAESKNAIFVAAAGNEAKDVGDKADPMYPGGLEGHKNLFVVGSTEQGDKVSDFSNFSATQVHVAAPGSDIFSTVPGNKWESKSGTSMATPLVAGIVALGLQRGYAPDVAMQKMIVTSEKISGWEQKFISGGIVNIIEYVK